MNRQAIYALTLLALFGVEARATLIVDPPQAITQQVTVQLIQTALNDGSSPATVFGDATQRADIEAGIDAIWAQAGIDIKILPTIVRYNNTFAYQGTAGSGTRPQADLGTIISNASAAGGILNSDPLVIDLFLVNIVPGFAPLSENTSAGLANVGRNGITGFTGDSLLTFDNGRDVISSVFAHEIGHNLGLNHTPNGTANLMSPNGTSQQLSSAQILTAHNSNFARLFTPPSMSGDYNKNGVVDAADYIVWRNTLNQTGTSLPADGSGNGRVDSADFSLWRSRFGSTGGSGSAVAGVGAVPEPSTAVLLALISIALLRRQKRHSC